MPTQEQPHRLRHIAESFGADAERYDRTRPRYPTAVIDAIVENAPGRRVLDVGCGTGISSRQFQAAGCTVLGVDVDARMAEWARRRGLDVEVGAFETWDPAGRVFDAVVAGQTWHWIDPVAGAARAAEVLRPGGRLAVFWNAHQPPSGLAEAIVAVYRRVLPDSPMAAAARADASDAYAVMAGTAADGIRAAGGLGEPEQWRHDWEHVYTRDEWLDQVPSHGGHSQLPAGQLDAILAGIGAAVDAVGGSFPMRYTTVTVTALRE
ncbi:class I SAM-dependent methyltransferase [Virgisporangium aurantiacum]|uniref:Methyltransferase type 11 n=1 Tax=Virgisporangium aurantiacum TaxID=175570 RepID=A0A8J4E1G2_9ACTN|nr:class I SAM-dependent methyltransferase [Virgisporangium aurantiacum]GIJ57836.1 methyltransferase type 11 [Virgisporangium aurantiacum]